MKKQFENIKYLYGDCSIRLPNSIFRTLSKSLLSDKGRANGKQIAFCYSYLATIGFLYKYASFVDLDNASYLQNSDIKELLGYSKTTKSVDKLIKKGGLLDELELTLTTKDYPLRFHLNHDEKINNIPLREYDTVSDADEMTREMIKEVVKNRNYEVKEPLFMTTATKDSEYGTMYSVERTHEITINELMRFLFDSELDNIDFLIYGFLKSRCKGYKSNMKALAIYKMVNELGIDRSTFYNHISILKEREYIAVTHKKWQKKQDVEIVMEANEYYWLGVSF